MSSPPLREVPTEWEAEGVGARTKDVFFHTDCYQWDSLSIYSSYETLGTNTSHNQSGTADWLISPQGETFAYPKSLLELADIYSDNILVFIQ